MRPIFRVADVVHGEAARSDLTHEGSRPADDASAGAVCPVAGVQPAASPATLDLYLDGHRRGEPGHCILASGVEPYGARMTASGCCVNSLRGGHMVWSTHQARG
jgi:hypothetical protein